MMICHYSLQVIYINIKDLIKVQMDSGEMDSVVRVKDKGKKNAF